MLSPTVSSQKGATQPPYRKPPVGSSSGPPGACMTPSSDTKAPAMILRIDGLAGDRAFDRGDVDFAHRHHRLEGALGLGLVGTADRLEQDARGDLPGEAPAVLAPAAFAFCTAILRDRVPV